MFTKHRSTQTAKFYKNNESPKMDELYSGYLHKSPDLSGITKGRGKAWKRRFFVLYKEERTYYLAYYRNKEKREKPLRKIDLSKVNLIHTCPKQHQMWDWIQKNFKCSSDSVLYLRVEDFMSKCAREYFLIGENSEDVGKWEKELLKVIRTLGKDSRVRTISEPIPKSPPCDEGMRVIDPKPFRLSAPIFSSRTMPYSHYDVPSSYTIAACKSADVCSDDDDEDDTEETPETPETPEDISEYMDMASVREVLQNRLEEDACIQTNRPTATEAGESSQDLCHAAENQKKDSSMRRNSAGLRCSKGSLLDFCASTEINKSETQKEDVSKTLIFKQEQGKLCVSECKKNETSHMFHMGDQILAFNDLLIDAVEET